MDSISNQGVQLIFMIIAFFIFLVFAYLIWLTIKALKKYLKE